MPKIKLSDISNKLKQIPDKVKELVTKTPEEQAKANLKEAVAIRKSIDKINKRLKHAEDTSPDVSSQYKEQIDQIREEIEELKKNFKAEDTESETEDSAEDSEEEDSEEELTAEEVLEKAKEIEQALKKITKRVEKEIAAFRKNEEELIDGSLVRKKLTDQYIKNKEFLEKQPVGQKNPVLEYAQEQIERVVNGLTRATGGEIGILRLMATRIMLTSEDEMRKVKEGKDKATFDENDDEIESAADRLERRKKNLKELLEALEEKLEAHEETEKLEVTREEAVDDDEAEEPNEMREPVRRTVTETIDKDFEGNFVLNPPSNEDETENPRYHRNAKNNLKYSQDHRRFIDTSLSKQPQFENVESLHDHDNFDKFIKAVAQTASTLKSLYLMRELTREQRQVLREEEIRARMFKDRLDLYQKFLGSVSYNTGNMIKTRNDEIVKSMALLTKAQDLSGKNKLGFLGEKVDIIDRDAAIPPAPLGILPGASTEKHKLKKSASFNPETQERVIRHSFVKKDGGVADQQAAAVSNPAAPLEPNQVFTTRQTNLAGRFYSAFQYTRADVEKLSSENQTILAIREAENILKSMKEPYAMVRLTGDWPNNFVQSFVDFMALKGAMVDNQCIDPTRWGKDKSSTITPGLWSKRSLASDLKHKEEFRTKVYGSDVPLEFQADREKLHKITKSTTDHLAQYVSSGPKVK